MKRSFFPLVVCVICFLRVQAFSRPAISRAATRAVLPSRTRKIRTFLFQNPRGDSNGKKLGRNGKKIGENELEFQLHTSISDISPVEWNACLAEESSSPFLHHSWLRCLEESKCACAETGWLPQHVSISIGKEIVGVVPLYIKGHSMGEFIFDNQFAEAANQSGINYYPKLLAAVPFTPVTGNRILWHPEKILQACSRDEITELNRAVADFLKQIATSNNFSSVHVNFLTDEEATDLAGPVKIRSLGPKSEGIQEKIRTFFRGVDDKDDYLRRTSVQYHWTNSDPNRNGLPFKSFGDYLNCFKSKKRINIRRERRRVLEDEKVKIDVVAGKDILKYDGLVKRMFDIYLSTIDKLIWGRQYLKLEFFEMLSSSDFVDNIVFVCARQDTKERKFRAEDVFAGTFSKFIISCTRFNVVRYLLVLTIQWNHSTDIVKDGVFYGRYWVS